MRTFDPIQGVSKSHRIARIRLRAAVLGTVRADQAADNRGTAGHALPADAGDDRRPSEVDGDGRKIHPVHARRHAVDARLRAVVSELCLIDERGAQDLLEADHSVLAECANPLVVPGCSQRRARLSRIAEIASRQRVSVVDSIIETHAAIILVYGRAADDVRKAQIRVRCRTAERISIQQRTDGDHGTGAGRCTWNRLNEVLIPPLPQAFE